VCVCVLNCITMRQCTSPASLQTSHHRLSLAAKCSLGLTLSCEVHIWMSYIAHVTEGTGEFHSNSGVTWHQLWGAKPKTISVYGQLCMCVFHFELAVAFWKNGCSWTAALFRAINLFPREVLIVQSLPKYGVMLYTHLGSDNLNVCMG